MKRNRGPIKRRKNKAVVSDRLSALVQNHQQGAGAADWQRTHALGMSAVTDDFISAWDAFCQEFDTRNRRLQKEIEACCSAADAMLRKHADLFTSDVWRDLPKGSLSSILETVRTKGVSLLFDPLLALKKTRALERAVSVLGKYPDDIEDVLRLLPQTCTASRTELAGILSRKGRWIDRCIPGSGTKPRPFRVRDTVRTVLQEHLNDRLRWDGKMIVLLARASLSLLFPWVLYRSEALNAAGDMRYGARDLSGDREDWLQRISDSTAGAKHILAAYASLEKRLPDRLAAALLSDRKKYPAKRSIERRSRWQTCFSRWSFRQRAVTAELELEYSSGKLLETAAGISSEYLASIDEEHARILAEMDTVHDWLVQWLPGKHMDPFPTPEARLVASEERAASWNKKLAAAARAALPVRVELVDAESGLGGRHPSGRLLEPEKCITDSLKEVGHAVALSGFREAEEGHRAIIREIERAREVVAYSMEGDLEESGLDSEVASEGIQNAISLLEYQKKSVVDFHPVVERRLAEALAASFYRFHIAISESKLGLYRHLVRQKGGRALRAGALSFYEKTKTGFRRARDKGIAQRDRALISIGWAPPPTTAVQPVVRREFLGELLHLKVVPRELPALYKRLFRLEPLEDPRFLVGRDAEIGAMAQARRQWEEGRPISVCVAGARGSGKTSLLNCAHIALFNDLTVISGQFNRRIETPAELHAFLGSLFRVEVQQLLPFLQSEKRVVILEEVERTFVRKIGGFHALRALMSLISATSKNTLWILSLNQVALNFLESVISFEENFSHRINAMAVAQEHLTEAVLLRHNLSGLRLQLTSPKTDHPRIDALQRFLGLERNPEQYYFESLYRQSEGIFRSAFELWLQSVDRIEGGVLYMLSPAQPEYGRMFSQLTLEDIFKLQAVLQHGSLTAEELAQIFDESIETCTLRTDKLAAWDILEPDPICPGFRVRPAAGRFVRYALYRQNLL
jgi:two-component sensor histidine kinase